MSRSHCSSGCGPGYLRDQPGRVLHGPGGRADAQDGGGLPGRGSRREAARQVLDNTLELAGELTVRHARAFSERINPDWSSTASSCCAGKSYPGRSATPSATCSGSASTRAHPVGGRPATRSLHLRCPQPGRHDRGPRTDATCSRSRCRRCCPLPRADAEPVRADRGFIAAHLTACSAALRSSNITRSGSPGSGP